MKYEAPEIEIVKFSMQSCVLTASVFGTESPVEDNTEVTIDEEYDPFNP